jgi:hypothetical protein
VAYLLKARTVEPDKQPLLGNGCATRNNGVTVGSGIFSAVGTKAIKQEGVQRHIEAAAMRKNCKREEHKELERDPLGGCNSPSSPHQSRPMQLY